MRNKLILLLEKNKQFKNFSTLAFGTILSQVLLVTVSPLLTRVFSPSDFGVFSTFTSIAVIFSIVFSGRYELAIGLPEEDEKAISLMKLILKLSVFASIFILIGTFVFWILDQLNFLKPDLFNFSYFLLPVYTLLVINNSSLMYWINRKKRYAKISASILISVIFNIGISLFLGFVGIKQLGMLLGLVVGVLTSLLFLYNAFLDQERKENSYKLKLLAQEYSSFPKYTLFSDLALNLNQQYLPIVFAIFYNSHIVGIFSLANRMLRLPNIVFTTSISNIFRNEAIDELREKGNCKTLYLGIFKKLILIGLLAYSLIYFMSPYLFKLFFGSQWEESGEFAQILCVMLFFEFISQPFNSLFYIQNSQKMFLKLQTFQTFLSIGIVLFALFLKMEVKIILIIYSFISVLFSFTNLYYTFKLSQNND